MKRLTTVLLLAMLAAPVAAQRGSWQMEFGVQGGYSQIKPAGTGRDDKIKAFDLPGSSFILGILTSAPVYAIIPWKDKIAIEPSLGFSQSQVGTEINLASLGLRVDYALNKDFYAAAGGVLGLLNSGAQDVKQLGVTAALGYRRHLVGPLNGRLEASATFRKKTTDLAPLNTYSVLFGVSMRTSGAPARAARSGAARAWEPALGVQGGYVGVHAVGGAFSASSFAMPGFGGSAEALGIPLGGPPSLFAIIPLGTKMAFEPGLDLRHVEQPNSSSTINAAGRLDYAVHGGWYGAVGATMTNVNPSTQAAKWVAGAQVAWGYRFRLTSAFGGRAEMSYNMRKKSTDLGLPPINIFAVSLGATVPLK